MNKICQLLDFDADVLLFNQDTYIVSKFKELILENFRGKFCTQLREHHSDFSVSGLFKRLSINEVNFPVEDMTWQSSISCKVFRVGSTGWQPGKLRIKVSTEIISPLMQREGGRLSITVKLEFYPDEPNEPESPLDDIRKLIQAT